jgi:hypothetical protein
MGNVDWSEIPKTLAGHRIKSVVHEERLDSRDTIRLLLDDGDTAIISIFNGDVEECNGLQISFESERRETRFESIAIIKSIDFTADQAILRFEADSESTFDFVDRCEGTAFFVDIDSARALVEGDRVTIKGRYSESEYFLDDIRRTLAIESR